MLSNKEKLVLIIIDRADVSIKVQLSRRLFEILSEHVNIQDPHKMI